MARSVPSVLHAGVTGPDWRTLQLQRRVIIAIASVYARYSD